MVRSARKAYARKGSKVVEIDPMHASKEEILTHFLGRSGVMRAPVFQYGDTLIAGFDPDKLNELL